jgi:filamentous hemagglutinin
LAGTAAVSVINNKGNLGNTVKDNFSSNSLKNALIASVTASMIDYADHNWFASAGDAANGGSKVITAGPTQNPGYASSMLQPDSWANTLARSGTHALINSGVSTAVNGGSFGSNLGGALVSEGIDLGAAAGNNAIHKLADGLGVAPAIAEKMVLHAALGGLIAKARGEDFASGAIAGGVAEGLTPIANAALAEFVSARFNPSDMSVEGSQYKIATAQIIGLIAAGAAGGNPATGSLIGGTGERYNEQGFQDPTSMFDDNSMPLQKPSPEIDKVKEQVSLAILGILFPAALEEMAAGTLAKIAGMFSESTEGGALAGASSGGRAVGAVDAGAGAGEAVSVPEAVAAGGGPKEAVDNAAKLSQGQQRAVNKIDNILNSFKDSDITGTLRDMAGDPVPKPDGGYWDHLKEMNDMLRGLRNHAETLEGVSDPVAQAARQRALNTIQRINSALNGAGI